MSGTSLGRIFDAGGHNQIELLIEKLDDRLTAPVSSGPYELTDTTLKTGGNSQVQMFGVPLKLEAVLELKARIATGEDTAHPLPEGTLPAIINLKGNLGVDGTVSAHGGALQLSAEGSLATGFEYFHLRPVAGEISRLRAFELLVRGTQLPQWAKIERMEPGEVLRFSAMLKVDFGLKGAAGKAFDLSQVITLFDDVSFGVKAHVQMSIEASLGWAMYEATDLEVRRQLDGSVRILCKRNNRRALTLGAAFGLAVDYDAATGIEAILDKALATVRMPETIQTFRRVNALAASGGWDTVKREIGGIGAEVVNDYLDATNWKDWAADNEAVAKFLNTSRKLVKLYDSLDERALSLWNDVLVRANLAKGSSIRTAIEKIAAIDPENPRLDDFLGEDWKRYVDLLETFCSCELEELILEEENAGEVLGAAVSTAKQLLTLIEGLPAEGLENIHRVLERSGVAASVNWLKDNALTLDVAEAKIHARIVQLVERLVNKSFDQLTPAQLQRVKRWAERLDRILSAPHTINRELGEEVARLRGHFGVNIALNWSRVTESSALLDLEVDPDHAGARAIVGNRLGTGELEKLINELADLKTDDQGELPFLVRESAFLSRKTLASGLTLALGRLGIRTNQSRTVEERIRIHDSQRLGTFAGIVVQRVFDSAADAESSTAVRLHARSADLHLDAPWQKVNRSLWLSFSRADGKTTQREMSAIERLLKELGFVAMNGNLDPNFVKHQPTQLSLSIRLPETAVDALVAGLRDPTAEDLWDHDMRSAFCRWVGDGFVTQRIQPHDAELGELLAAVVASPRFQETWRSHDKFVRGARTNPYKHNNRPLAISTSPTAFVIAPPYDSLRVQIHARGPRYAGLVALENRLTGIDSKKPETGQLLAAARAAAKAFATVGDEWRVPLLNLWYALARISRANPAALAKASGIATFRHRSGAAEEWRVTRLRLRNGIPDLTREGALPVLARKQP
jgi:hypothetical protein